MNLKEQAEYISKRTHELLNEKNDDFGTYELKITIPKGFTYLGVYLSQLQKNPGCVVPDWDEIENALCCDSGLKVNEERALMYFYYDRLMNEMHEDLSRIAQGDHGLLRKREPREDIPDDDIPF
jgi:hypothetical protein